MFEGTVSDLAIGAAVATETGAFISDSIAPPHPAAITATNKELANLIARKLPGKGLCECMVNSYF